MADGTKPNTYALTSLAKVKAAIEKTELTADSDAQIVDLINGVSAWCERHCKRKFLSRQYVHDGTTLELLRGRGTNVLFLPQRPVTAVASVKKTPDDNALTEGWDQDFEIDKGPGLLRLAAGDVWPTAKSIEITYTAGYLKTASEPWGWVENCQDLENSVIRAVAFLFKRSGSLTAAITSVSQEAGTLSFESLPMLKDVERVWNSFAGRKV